MGQVVARGGHARVSDPFLKNIITIPRVCMHVAQYEISEDDWQELMPPLRHGLQE